METRVQWFREQFEETIEESEREKTPDFYEREKDETADAEKTVEKVERVEIAPIVIGEEQNGAK